MKRKRLEAWGEVHEGELVAVHVAKDEADSWGRVIRMVEHSPAEASVVRAAVRLIDECTFSVGRERAPILHALQNAVTRLERERSKGTKP